MTFAAGSARSKTAAALTALALVALTAATACSEQREDDRRLLTSRSRAGDVVWEVWQTDECAMELRDSYSLNAYLAQGYLDSRTVEEGEIPGRFCYRPQLNQPDDGELFLHKSGYFFFGEVPSTAVSVRLEFEGGCGYEVPILWLDDGRHGVFVDWIGPPPCEIEDVLFDRAVAYDADGNEVGSHK